MFSRAYVSLLLLFRLIVAALPCPAAAAGVPGFPFGDQHEEAHRAEAELSQGEADFDQARNAYDSGNIEKGDAALEAMTKSLDACVASLAATHKARYYKKAELRVATLQRRMSALLEDIDLPQRGWAEQTSRKLDEIHDKLLGGVMAK